MLHNYAAFNMSHYCIFSTVFLRHSFFFLLIISKPNLTEQSKQVYMPVFSCDIDIPHLKIKINLEFLNKSFNSDYRQSTSYASLMNSSVKHGAGDLRAADRYRSPERRPTQLNYQLKDIRDEYRTYLLPCDAVLRQAESGISIIRILDRDQVPI